MSKDTGKGIFLGWIKNCSGVRYFEEKDVYLVDTPDKQLEIKGFLDSVVPSRRDFRLFDLYFSDGTNEPL